MYSDKAIDRVKLINKKIGFIESIIKENKSIEIALADEQNARASLLMHLTSIAEQLI